MRDNDGERKIKENTIVIGASAQRRKMEGNRQGPSRKNVFEFSLRCFPEE
jgi:hypothetical protein